MWLANPIALWALAGLLVPIAIHLLSRKEGPVIRIGSLRHLNESATKQFRSIRLNEKLLLVVRLLLLLIIVFMLAQLHTPAGNGIKWLLIEPSLASHALAQHTSDSLTSDGYEVHYLAPGFPTEAVVNHTQHSYQALMNDLGKQPIEKAVVLSASNLLQFGWMASPLPDFVTWITLEPEDNAFVLFQRQIATDSVLLRKGLAQRQELSFESSLQLIKEADQGVPVLSADSLTVAIHAEAATAFQSQLITQALQIIGRQTHTKIITTPYSPTSQTDWVVWLSQQPIPSEVQRSIALRESAGESLLVPVSNHNWHLTKSLTSELAWKENLPVQLAAILLAKRENKLAADARDVRVLPETMQWRTTPVAASVHSGASAHTWLAVLLALVFLTERILAYWKKA